MEFNFKFVRFPYIIKTLPRELLLSTKSSILSQPQNPKFMNNPENTHHMQVSIQIHLIINS